MTKCSICQGIIESTYVRVKRKYYHHDCFDRDLGRLLGISKKDLELIKKVVNYV